MKTFQVSDQTRDFDPHASRYLAMSIFTLVVALVTLAAAAYVFATDDRESRTLWVLAYGLIILCIGNFAMIPTEASGPRPARLQN